MAEKEMDCEFNAPQFFDFNEMMDADNPGGSNPDDKLSAEKYFAFDHENGVPVDIDGEANVAQSNEEAPIPSTTLKSALSERLRRQETPKRRSLREAVAKRAESVENSPALKLARRSNLIPPAVDSSIKVHNLDASSTESATVTRLKKVVKSLTPEILKKARSLRRNGPEVDPVKVMKKPDPKPNEGEKHSAPEVSKEKKQQSSGFSEAASSVRQKVTRPEPFTFATDNLKQKSRVKRLGQEQEKPGVAKSKPMKAIVGNVDFAKMMKTYNSNPQEKQERMGRRRSKSFSSLTGSAFGKIKKAGSVQSVASTSSSTSSNRSLNHPGTKRTEVQPFSFVDQDLENVRKRYQEAKKSGEKSDFYKTLRSYPQGESSGTSSTGSTKVKPFSFLSRPLRRRSRSADPGNRTSDLNKLDDKSGRIIKAKPIPSSHHHGVPVVLPNMSKKTTQLLPFSFDTRDQTMLQKKQMKIEEMLKQEKKDREFKANPIPDLKKPVKLPLKEPLVATKAKPFNLEIEKRVEARIEKFQQELEEKLRKEREETNFRANPLKVLEQPAFIPKKSDRPLAEVSNFELHSEKRAKEREEYDCKKKQREAELESLKRQRDDRKRFEEEEEMKRWRKETVHKPLPLKHCKPLEIHQSSKPPTEPISPKFSDRFNK